MRITPDGQVGFAERLFVVEQIPHHVVHGNLDIHTYIHEGRNHETFSEKNLKTNRIYRHKLSCMLAISLMNVFAPTRLPVWKKQMPARFDQEHPKLLKIKPVRGWMLNNTLQWTHLNESTCFLADIRPEIKNYLAMVLRMADVKPSTGCCPSIFPRA